MCSTALSTAQLAALQSSKGGYHMTFHRPACHYHDLFIIGWWFDSIQAAPWNQTVLAMLSQWGGHHWRSDTQRWLSRWSTSQAHTLQCWQSRRCTRLAPPALPTLQRVGLACGPPCSMSRMCFLPRTAFNPLGLLQGACCYVAPCAPCLRILLRLMC